MARNGFRCKTPRAGAVFVRALVTAYAFAALLVLTGCSENNSPVGPIFLSRSVNLAYAAIGAITGQNELNAPAEIGFSILVSFGNSDLSRNNAVTRLELDPGDSSGWRDITSEYYEYLNKQRSARKQVSFLDTYIYAEPGVYELQARACYWDGEVVNSIKHTITVLPAEEKQQTPQQLESRIISSNQPIYPFEWANAMEIGRVDAHAAVTWEE